MAMTASARTRPSAACRGTSSPPKGFTKPSILARASATVSSAPKAAAPLCGTLAPTPVNAGRAAAFLQQGDAFDHHGTVRRLQHVIDGEAGDRNRREGFHLHSGLA